MKNITRLLIFILALGAIGLAIYWSSKVRMNSPEAPTLPEVVPYKPGSIKPAPPLPSLDIPTGPVAKEPKLVPPRKDLPPAPPVPNMKEIMARPVNKKPQVIPPRKDLPPAPPLPSSQLPGS
jgi:hypothetical protein